MLSHALKEWAVICRALEEGRQALLLRKGGIAEAGGEFQVEHNRFWLYPTYVHQQNTGIKAGGLDLLQEVERERPPVGILRFSHVAEVVAVYHVHNLATALLLDDFHLWSAATVQARFTYRRPGLFVLPIRVYRTSHAQELPETPQYAGCKSWVELGRPLPTDGASPVLGQASFDEFLGRLNDRLQPTALA